MKFNISATLLAAIAFTFTAALSNVKTGKPDNTKLAPAPPVRGGKKQHQQHRSSSSSSRHSSVPILSSSSSSKPSCSSSSKTSSSSSSVSSTKQSRSSRPSSSSSSSHPSSSSRSSRTSSSKSSSRTSRSLSVLESSSLEKTKICTRELEAILFGPPSNVKDYMAKIADEIRADIHVIMAAFAGGNLDYLRNFVNKYNILITLYGPFGAPVLIAPTFAAYTDPLMSVGAAQTYSGRDGFYVDTASKYYNYQFVLMSSNGQLLNFVLSLPLSQMTYIAADCK